MMHNFSKAVLQTETCSTGIAGGVESATGQRERDKVLSVTGAHNYFPGDSCKTVGMSEGVLCVEMNKGTLEITGNKCDHVTQ